MQNLHVPTATLPKGWHWNHYEDGSGGLRSPEGKSSFSYDLATSYAVRGDIEFKRTPYHPWEVFHGTLTEFQAMAESEIRRVLPAEIPSSKERATKTRIGILKDWESHRFADFGGHPSLKALGVDSNFLGPDEECDFDELVFAVPEKWLIDTCIREFRNLKIPSDVQYWLDNIYTSDEAHAIFCLAMNANQLVMLNFN